MLYLLDLDHAQYVGCHREWTPWILLKQTKLKPLLLCHCVGARVHFSAHDKDTRKHSSKHEYVKDIHTIPHANSIVNLYSHG
jgi:hypothetical protein